MQAAILSPADISGLRFWVHAEDAKEADNSAAEDGDTVTLLEDRSTNGIDLNVVSGTPTFSATGFDGGAALRLNATTDGLASTSNIGIGGTNAGDLPAAQPEFTVFVHAIVADSHNTTTHLVGWGSGAAARQQAIVEIETTNDRFDGAFGFGDDKQTANDSMDSRFDTEVRFAFRFDGTGGNPVSDADLFYNGVQSDVASGSNNGVGIVNSPVFVGRSASLSLQAADSFIEQIIIYDRALTDTEIAAVDFYLEFGAIPEPSSVALFAVGGLLLVPVWRRRRPAQGKTW